MSINPFEHPLFIYSKNPRHKGELEHFTHIGSKGNPSCGDEVVFYVRVKNGRIEAISFEGRGCSVSQASADMLAEWVIGKTVEEISKLTDDAFLEEVIGGVIPTRIRCALVSLQALRKALEKKTNSQV